MYLFDTDIVSNIFKPVPSARLLKMLKSIPREDQYISTITLYEIVYGACKSTRKLFHIKNLKELLLPAVQIAGFDSKAAYVCGSLRAELEGKGMSLALADLQIASIALANDFTLITGNIRHFRRITHLKAENWL
jgi:tRNA(fMet)-specific endonuclease VapC